MIEPIYPTAWIKGPDGMIECKPVDLDYSSKRVRGLLHCDIHDWPDDEWAERMAELAGRGTDLKACGECLEKCLNMGRIRRDEA